MKRITSLFLGCLLLLPAALRADEGMWLPFLIEQKIADMQALGCQLSAQDIYSVNQACLKDAVVQFGSGCTGEMISSKGLLITNHHCGFSQIQAHSSVEHDYLREGFWAMSAKEELPNPGLTVTFLRRMEDVTKEVLKGVKPTLNEKERTEAIDKNIQRIVKHATENTVYTAFVRPCYYGNQYILYVNEVFKDVRLVGAPPSAIGKFGGDTDNWMWPRHTGDFSIFRVYANKDNQPAEYHQDNVPYKPLKSLDISLGGVKEGDFTLVYGFPGSTREYISSHGVDYIASQSNPMRIDLRTQRLEVMNKYMAQDPRVRIMYAAKNASVANGWKKWQGELLGLTRLRTVAKKEAFETAFTQWAADKKEYKDLVSRLAEAYKGQEPYSYAYDCYVETARSVEILRFAGRVDKLLRAQLDDQKAREAVRKAMQAFYKDYYPPIDQACFTLTTREFLQRVPERFRPALIQSRAAAFGGDTGLWAEDLFKYSVFASQEKALDCLERANFRSLIQEDPALLLCNACDEVYQNQVLPGMLQYNQELDLLYRDYMRGQMAFDTLRTFFPDANLTLRVSYGQVKGYSPRDGVVYRPYTTLEGIMEKDKPEIYDYNVPQKLRDLYAAKDYGRWAVDGTVPVAFLAANHTTGGNSGSPILNARGALLGLNFDRTWEGTMSDIEYDPQVCRNISVDIRYVLFVVEKIGGAGYLLEEMNFVD